MILNKQKHIDEKYSYLSKYGDIMWKSFWTPAKYQKNIQKIDIPFINNKMDIISNECVKRTLLASSLIEDKVKTFWSFLVTDIPQTVVGEVGAIFGNSEVVHAQSYRFLIESLNLIKEFENLQQIPVMKGRIEYLNKHLTKSNLSKEKQVLKKLVLFTALVERISLFSQFYIIMSFDRNNKGLKTLYSLQSTTAREELYHYQFGLALINIIKQENPELWDSELKTYVEDAIQKAYKAEINLLDWIFEKGYPSHLSHGEILNFINFNFNEVCKDLEVSNIYIYDNSFYYEKNEWMLQGLQPSEPDFFANPVGGYSSVDTEVSDDELDDIFK